MNLFELGDAAETQPRPLRLDTLHPRHHQARRRPRPQGLPAIGNTHHLRRPTHLRPKPIPTPRLRRPGKCPHPHHQHLIAEVGPLDRHRGR